MSEVTMEELQEINLRKSKTAVKHRDESWYILDNAAIIMPATTNARQTSLFRISASLEKPVRLVLLQEALEAVCPRFPYFLVELRRGFFWYYFEPLKKTPKVEADSRSPCQNIDIRKRGGFLFRIRTYGNRIACEFSHVLADGSGALAFLEALLCEYFRLGGVEIPDYGEVFKPGQVPTHEEAEDAYNRFFKGKLPYPEISRKAFHMTKALIRKGKYRIITGILPLEAVAAKAKSFGASITEYLVALHLAALQDVYLALPEKAKKRANSILAVEVPVNLRKLYPSKTLRNFSLFVLPSIDPRLGFYPLPEIVERVHHYMRTEVNDKDIQRQISRNVGTGRLLFVRLVPLFMKNLFAKLFYVRYGQSLFSGFMSNLGRVELPKPLDDMIERFDFIPAPDETVGTNASVLSWKDRLYISFGSLFKSSTLEMNFFRLLAREGIPVRVESNE